jgi:hypothetical protein
MNCDELKKSGIREFKISEILNSNNLGIYEFWNSGIHEFGNSEFHIS